MIYKSSEGDIDLSKVIRLYGAVVIDMQGEIAEMSLEWYDMYSDKVKLVDYVLVFDYTQAGDKERSNTTLHFETKEALIQEMQKVAQLFN